MNQNYSFSFYFDDINKAGSNKAELNIVPQLQQSTANNTNMSGSFDFVDLDEDSFSDIKHFNNFPKFPKVTPILNSNLLNSEESSIFIRSTSPIQREPSSSSAKLKPVFNEFELKLETGKLLRFNPKGPSHEGRDSQVFRGQLHDSTNSFKIQEVAVKVYKSDPLALEGAQKEIKIFQEITQNRSDFLKLFFHGNVTILNSEEFISVWEWIDGGTIDRVISKLSPEQIILVIKSLANSIGHLHANHLAHHDLKPQNILITTDLQRIVLIDFGDSKHISSCDFHSNDNRGSYHSHSIPLDEGIGLGTLAYTAPELLSRKADFYDPFASDVYSYGVLLFYFLNHGSILPFHTLIPHRAVQLILTVQKGFFVGGYNPEKPRESPFYPLMLKCLQVKPEERPKFSEILKELFLN